MARPRIAALGFVALLAGVLPGCTLIPDFLRPAAPIPTGWPEGPAYRQPPAANLPTNAPTADQIGWRDFFADARLQQVIELALSQNRDLRTAVLNIAVAEAQYRAQRGALFPEIDGTASLSARRIPPGASGFSGGSPTAAAAGAAGGTAAATGSSAGRAINSRVWSAGIGVSSYEIDLFGRVQSLSAQAFEQYLGYAETRRSSQLSLISQVAGSWLTVAADQDLLALTRETLRNQEDGYRLTRASFDGGNATELALRQAQTSVETARANLSLYTRQLAQDVNALNLLVGAAVPDNLLPTGHLEQTPLPPEIPEGLSSDLLLRRPDVLAAERNLIAANANIGAARAAFFPSITLTASAGTSSGGLNRLFAPGSAAFSFAPTLNVPIFNGGVNWANLDAAKRQRDLQVANYERTLQTAFREVADALAGRGTYDEQIAAQQRLVDAYAAAYRLSLLRFRAGLDTYQSPLDSQRNLYAGQQNLITLRLERLQNLVTLYKALGGGWEERTRVAVGPR